MFFSNIQQLTKYLYALPHLHAKSNLYYIKRILAALGNPQNLVKTIHITGTNGKGSTAYYLSSLLEEAGQRTGLFVSPYVREFNERIQLNGQDIPNADLVKLANQVQEKIEEIQQQEADFDLVTFEFEVALAFLYFAQKKCSYAVIEVGIGGEHDKTNVIVPEVSIITTIGLDHEKIIGPTIQDIAQEKSGIIKKKRPVVLGNIPPEVLPILLKKAKQEKAPVYLFQRDFSAADSFKKAKVEQIDIAISLQAFALLKLPLTPAQERQAIARTKIPGRYQFLQQRPAILLDGAHNIQAIDNVLQYSLKLARQRGGKLLVMLAMMRDKDIGPVLKLMKRADQVVLTTIAYPRAAKETDFRKKSPVRYPYQSDWKQLYRQLRQELRTNDVLLVTGSFYLISAVLNRKGN